MVAGFGLKVEVQLSQSIGLGRVVPPLGLGCPRTLADDYGRQVVDLPKKKGVHWTSVNALGRYGGGLASIEPSLRTRMK